MSTNLKLYIQILYLKFEIHIDLINEVSYSQLMGPLFHMGESDKVFEWSLSLNLILWDFVVVVFCFSQLCLYSWWKLVQPPG